MKRCLCTAHLLLLHVLLLPNPQSSHPTQKGHLAAEDTRTRVLIRCRNRVVDVDLDTGVIRLISTWEGDLVRRISAAAASDSQLSTRNVELGTTRGAGAVQSNMLSAEQIVSGPDTPGDGDRESALACGLEYLR
jgi:hypothetical protein